MDKGYTNIFWGLFIATFNIKLGIIKILPAFIGWIVLRTGLDILNENYENDAFKSAAIYSNWLILLSLFGGLFSFMGAEYSNSSIIFSYSPVIIMIVELLMGYKVLEGSIEYLKSENKEIIALEYEGNLKTYIIFFLISLFTLIIAITLNSRGLITASAILAIIIRISLMVMVNKMKKFFISNEA